MAEFPYADWLTRSYMKRAENSGHWRDYLQAHGLANFCACREPTEKRCRLVYEIEKSWYKGEHPLSYTEYQQLTETHKKLLDNFRTQTRTDFEVFVDLGEYLDGEDVFTSQNMENAAIFCEATFSSSQKCCDRFVQVSKEILESSVQVLQRQNVFAPCKFVVIGLGSVAKGEATPYSDLEYAFIVEKEDEYFEKLAMDSYFRIGNLWETPLKGFDIPELKDKSNSSILLAKDMTTGYRIDGITNNAGNIPTGNGRGGGQALTLTVEELMKLYKMSAESPFDKLADKSDLLSSSVPIYTNEEQFGVETLHEKFLVARAEYEQGEARNSAKVQQKRFDSFAADTAEYTFLPEFVKFQPPSHLNIKVKTDIFRYPTLLANNLKMCLGLNIRQSQEAYSSLHQRGNLSAETLQCINIVLALSIYIRTAAYLKQKSQAEFVRIAPSAKTSSDTTYDVPANLFAILGYLLIPIKKTIISGMDILKDASIESLQQSLPSIMRCIDVPHRDYLLKAEVLYFMGYYKAAQKALDNAIGRSLETTSCSTFCKKVTLIQKRSTQKELSIFRKLLSDIEAKWTKQTEVDSSYTRKYAKLCSYILYYSEDYNSALDYFNWFINTERNNLGFWKLLAAHCYQKMGDYITARKLLSEAKESMEWRREEMDETPTYLLDSAFGADNQHADISFSYLSIGCLYHYMNEYEEALAYHTRALDMDIARYGDVEHPHIATHCYNIGTAYQCLSQYNLALEYYTNSLDMRKAVFGTDSNSIEIARNYNNVGVVYQLLGKYNLSLEYHVKSLDMCKVLFGEESNITEIAHNYNNVGIVYHLLGKYNLSLEYFFKSLDMCKVVFGEESNITEIAHNYNNVGAVYQLLGKYNLSLEYFVKSLDMHKAVFGEESNITEIAQNYNNVGVVYQLLGKYKLSLEYFVKSLDMYKAVFGEESNITEIADNYNNVAVVYRFLSKYNTSLEYHTKSMDMCKAIFGADSNHTDMARGYNNIGKVYQLLGEYNLSLEYHIRSLDMMKIIFDADSNHTEIADIYNSIGEVYRHLSKYTSSLEYHTKSLKMRKAISGADSNHPDIAASYNNIGVVYHLIHNYAAALYYHNISLNMKKDMFGADSNHTDIAASYNNIGETYRLQRRYELSLKSHVKGLEMRKTIFGADTSHALIAGSYNNIGEVYRLLGEYSSSLEYHDKALDMRKAIFGADSNHPDIAQTKKNIDRLHRVMK